MRELLACDACSTNNKEPPKALAFSDKILPILFLSVGSNKAWRGSGRFNPLELLIGNDLRLDLYSLARAYLGRVRRRLHLHQFDLKTELGLERDTTGSMTRFAV